MTPPIACSRCRASLRNRQAQERQVKLGWVSEIAQAWAAPELCWRLAALAMSRRAGDSGPGSDAMRSFSAARLTMSARMRRLSGSSSICSRSPVCTLCESANAFHPCSVYSYLLLFLAGTQTKSQPLINVIYFSKDHMSMIMSVMTKETIFKVLHSLHAEKVQLAEI